MISAAELLEDFAMHGRVPSDSEARKILAELGRRSSRTEFDRLDFKRQFNEDPTAWIDFVKHIVGIANSGGGVIVVGMTDDGERVGLGSSLLHAFDPTNIANKIRKYAPGAQIRVSYSEIPSYRKKFGFLWVFAGSRVVVFDKSIQYPGSDKTAIQQGVVYVRRGSATCPATQSEINSAVDRVVSRNVKAFVARIDHIASLPPSAQLIATNPETDRGYMLTASGEGIPVTIVGPKHGAPSVKIDETLLPDVPLSGPTHELANQVRQWRADARRRVNTSTLHRWYLSRDQLDFSAVSDGAEFALLSALDGSGFPMYWASKVELVRLKEILHEKSDDYPANLIIPYIIGGFFWNDRVELIRGIKVSPGVLERITECDDLDNYVKTIRNTGSLIRLPSGLTVRINDATVDKRTAQGIFDSILLAGDKCVKNNRMPMHQLDTYLHVPVAQER